MTFPPAPVAGARESHPRTLMVLTGYWCFMSGAVIEFYARRYEYAGTTLFPDAVLAILALGVLFIPDGVRTRLPVPHRTARAVGVGLVAGTALLLAIRHPLQLIHVLLALSLLGVALLGALLVLIAPIPRWLARLVTTLLLSTLNYLLLMYYLILIAGREIWNQVVSRELLWTYLWQSPDLVTAVPIDPWLPYAIVVAVYLVLVGAYWAASARIADGLVGFGKQIAANCASGGRANRLRLEAIVLVMASVLLAGEWLYRAAAFGPIPDPLVTTLFVEQDRPGSRHMTLTPDPVLQARDREIAASYAGAVSVARKTLVIITVDALRADQMNVYGHERDNTPFLSRMYREGKLTRFENAFSACTESFCGLLTIHASRFWHQLGTRNFSLADVLKRLGYRNQFVLGGDHANFYGLRSFYGQSIDDYRDGSSGAGYINDDLQVVDWVAQIAPADGVPRFLYIHLMSTHILGMRSPKYRRWYRTVAGADGAGNWRTVVDYVNSYHDGILQADALIEQIFGSLQTKGLLDDAIVAITADHGQMLGERGYGHGGPPVDPNVRVPLLIFDTDSFAYPARPLTSVIDIAPTLLDRIDAPIPAHWTGQSLARAKTRRFTFIQAGDRYAVIGRLGQELYKYHYDHSTGAEQLFNSSRDWVEREALPLDAHESVLKELRAELDAQIPSLRRGR